MVPEIQDYYKYLLGEVDIPPGPIVLPDGCSATSLTKVSMHLLHQYKYQSILLSTNISSCYNISTYVICGYILAANYITVLPVAMLCQTKLGCSEGLGKCSEGSKMFKVSFSLGMWISLLNSDHLLTKNGGAPVQFRGLSTE